MNDCEMFACAHRGCQSTIHLHHDVERKLRRTHETFYCPAGHSNYFPGKTDEEKKVDQVQSRLERFREMWHEALEREQDLKIEVRSCPFGCGYRVKRKQLLSSVRTAMVFHLLEEHGAKMPEPQREEALA